MTNRKLLRAAEATLSALDRQRLFLLRVEGTPMPCPACKALVNLFEAAGIDIDAYDFGVTTYSFHCPACSAQLDQMLPSAIMGDTPWRWQLKQSRPQRSLRRGHDYEPATDTDDS